MRTGGGCRDGAGLGHTFILHIGGGRGSEDHADNTIAEMKEYGCTPAFIEAYAEARNAGALSVLFHAGGT
jgi:hypothetical protein